MADIAQIGFAADTSGLEKAKSSLNALAPAADKVDKSSEKLSKTFEKVDGAADKLTKAASGLSSASEKLSAILSANAGAVQRVAAANDVAAVSSQASATATGELAVITGRLAAVQGELTVTQRAAAVSATTAAAAGERLALVDAELIAMTARLATAEQAQAVAQGEAAATATAAAAAGERLAVVDAQLVALTARLAASEQAQAVAQGEAAATAQALAAVEAELAVASQAAAAGQVEVAGASAAAGGAAGGAAVGVETLAAAEGTAAVGGLALAAGAVAAVVAIAALLAIVATAVFGVITFAGAFLSLRDEVGKTTDGLGLNEKQLDRLKKKGTDTGVTLVDAFTGLSYAVGRALKDAFEGPLKGITEWAKKAWDDILAFSMDALDQIVKVTVGSVAAIIAVWNDIPAIIGDLFFQGVNKVIDGYNSIVQAGWDFFYAFVAMIANIPQTLYDAFFGGVKMAGSALDSLYEWAKGVFNSIVSTWRQWPSILADLFMRGVHAAFDQIVWLYNKTVGIIKSLWDGAKALVTGDVGHVTNTYAGAAAGAADKAGAAYDRAGDAVDRFKKKFAADFRKGTLSARHDRLMEAAGDPGKPKKEPKGPKTDAEKFENIVKGANNDIATQKAKADATTLTAEAAATLEEKTKLLNAAQSKGIVLTDAMRGKIDELSAAYGKAKVAADNAVALRDILKGADKEIEGLKSQGELIGLVGRQLAYQTEMQKLLNEAKAKGLTVDAAMRAQFEGKANAFADQSQANAHDTFMDGVTKNAKERQIALQQEMSYIGKSADEVARLRIENELLAQARQKNIDLTPADIAAIQGIAAEQAKLEEQVRKAREGMEFARSTAKGFFKDFTDGLRSGKGLWDSFADAATKALDKIIDKLLDKVFDAALDKLFSLIGTGGSDGGILGSLFGGGSFAKGGTFGSGSDGNSGGILSFHAKGNAFGSGIINTPTMFAFANGGALGVMGEAGPEAVMPLQRGADGSLGVQMYGGSGEQSSSPAAIHVEVKNTFTLSGAVSSQDVLDLTKEAARKTEESVKRNMVGWLDQYQRDGAFSS